MRFDLQNNPVAGVHDLAQLCIAASKQLAQADAVCSTSIARGRSCEHIQDPLAAATPLGTKGVDHV